MDCWIAYYAPPFGVIPPRAVLALLLFAAAGVGLLIKVRPGFAPARAWIPFACVLGTAIGLATALAAFERCPGSGEWAAATLVSCTFAIVVLLGVGALHVPTIRAVARRFPNVPASGLAVAGAGILALALVVVPALIELTFSL